MFTRWQKDNFVIKGPQDESLGYNCSYNAVQSHHISWVFYSTLRRRPHACSPLGLLWFQAGNQMDFL